MVSPGTFFEAAGFVGGLILSGSLLPQVVKVARSRSTHDISYGWQFTYIVGLVPTLSYMFHFELWPVAVPGALELCMIVSLTVMKAWFEWQDKKSNEEKQLVQHVNGDGDGSGDGQGNGDGFGVDAAKHAVVGDEGESKEHGVALQQLEAQRQQEQDAYDVEAAVANVEDGSDQQ